MFNEPHRAPQSSTDQMLIKYPFLSQEEAGLLLAERSRFGGVLKRLNEKGFNVTYPQLSGIASVVRGLLKVDLLSINLEASRRSGMAYFLVTPAISCEDARGEVLLPRNESPSSDFGIEEPIRCSIEPFFELLLLSADYYLTETSFRNQYELWRDRYLQLEDPLTGRKIPFSEYSSDGFVLPPIGSEREGFIERILADPRVSSGSEELSREEVALAAMESRLSLEALINDFEVTRLISSYPLNPTTDLQRQLLHPVRYFEYGLRESLCDDVNFQRQLIKLHFHVTVSAGQPPAKDFDWMAVMCSDIPDAAFNGYKYTLELARRGYESFEEEIHRLDFNDLENTHRFSLLAAFEAEKIRLIDYLLKVVPHHKEWFIESMSDIL